MPDLKGVVPVDEGCTNLLFSKIFAEHCIEMKEIGRKERWSLATHLGPANGLLCFSWYQVNKQLTSGGSKGALGMRIHIQCNLFHFHKVFGKNYAK